VFVRKFITDAQSLEAYSPFEAIICDDLRYPDELDACRSLGFKVIFVYANRAVRKVRASAQGLDFIENHNSEILIPRMLDLADYKIDNSYGDVKALTVKVVKALEIFGVKRAA
jgi:hypothetical protein